MQVQGRTKQNKLKLINTQTPKQQTAEKIPHYRRVHLIKLRGINRENSSKILQAFHTNAPRRSFHTKRLITKR